MIERVFAGAVLLVCAALLLRMALPPARQQQFDRLFQGLLSQLRQAAASLRRRWQVLRSGRQARREAAAAIERARQGRPPVQRDGNVIRPERFGKGDAGRGDSTKPPLH